MVRLKCFQKFRLGNFGICSLFSLKSLEGNICYLKASMAIGRWRSSFRYSCLYIGTGFGVGNLASLDAQQTPETSCLMPVLSIGLVPDKTFSVICQLSLRGR